MKPGATTLPRGIDGALAGRGCEIADGGDVAVADADVAGIPGRAGAIDDVAVGDDEVESGGDCAGDGEVGSEKQHEHEIKFVKLHRFSFLHRHLSG